MYAKTWISCQGESSLKLNELILSREEMTEIPNSILGVTAFLEPVSLIIDENQFYQRKPFVFAPHEGTYKK